MDVYFLTPAILSVRTPDSGEQFPCTFVVRLLPEQSSASTPSGYMNALLCFSMEAIGLHPTFVEQLVYRRVFGLVLCAPSCSMVEYVETSFIPFFGSSSELFHFSSLTLRRVLGIYMRTTSHPRYQSYLNRLAPLAPY
jgi:hypothetical protein